MDSIDRYIIPLSECSEIEEKLIGGKAAKIASENDS